jgi:4-hydroxybutyryl-CoA dehydratase / vinylacetyl-CoA-Delta-isomerase
MMTARQYEESLRELKLEVYLLGKRIENVADDPIIRPAMNAAVTTYELATIGDDHLFLGEHQE